MSEKTIQVTDTIDVQKGEETILSLQRPHKGDFLFCQSFAVESKLEEYAETTVDRIEKAGNRTVVRIRHHFLCPITKEVMLHALYHMGAITKQELLGDSSWRERLNAMPSLDGVPGAKPV